MGKEKAKFLKLLQDGGAAKSVLDVMEDIDRKSFFDPVLGDRVWLAEALPIGLGQKSEEPLILAKMIALLSPKKKWRLLEVGTGSGYSTAILSRMASSVVSVDYFEALAQSARERIIGAGFRNVRFFAGDATDFKENPGEFDGAVIFAGCIHTPFSILSMVKPGGVMVFPMGPPHQQQIVLLRNDTDTEMMTENYRYHDLCVFDSIRGRYGWADAPSAPLDREPPEKPPKKK